MFRDLGLNGAALAAAFMSALCGVACGPADDGPDAAASGAASNGGAAAGGASTAAGGDASGGSGGGGPAGGGAESSGGQGSTSPPVLCGGAYSRECGDGYFCRFTDGCGTVAHCTRRPTECDDVLEPVCGCDGATYSNECMARLAGVAVRDPGACDEAEQVPCGPYQCARSSYCLDKNGSGTSTIWQHACLTPPTECANGPACDCLGELLHCYPGQYTCEKGTGVTLTCN